MTYMPGTQPIPPMVSPFTRGIGPMTETVSGSVPSSATYENAARAVYCPVILQGTCVVRRVWWANGATVSGGASISVGIYAAAGYGPGARLVYGAATQGSASQVQFVDVTDTVLSPGLYYIAISSDLVTNTTLFRASVQDYSIDASILFGEESASPLPATATAVETTAANVYLFGFATTASP